MALVRVNSFVYNVLVPECGKATKTKSWKISKYSAISPPLNISAFVKEFSSVSLTKKAAALPLGRLDTCCAQRPVFQRGQVLSALSYRQDKKVMCTTRRSTRSTGYI